LRRVIPLLVITIVISAVLSGNYGSTPTNTQLLNAVCNVKSAECTTFLNITTETTFPTLNITDVTTLTMKAVSVFDEGRGVEAGNVTLNFSSTTAGPWRNLGWAFLVNHSTVYMYVDGSWIKLPAGKGEHTIGGASSLAVLYRQNAS